MTRRRRPRSRAGATPPRPNGSSRCCKFADAVEARAAELVDAEVRNTGKPRQLTADEELPPAVDQLRFFAGAARHAGGPVGRASTWPGTPPTCGASRSASCGQVTPWNYPLMMAIWKIAPALAAGNTRGAQAVGHHARSPRCCSPRSPPSSSRRACFNVVCGDRDTGRALVSHPVPQLVSITGSTRAGMEVAAAAAPDLKRTHLELGGKAPVVRLRRRRHGRGGRGDRGRRLLQRRPGLHRRHPGAGRPRHPRRLRGRAGRAGPRHQDRRAGRRGRALRPAQQRQPARPGHRLRRPAARPRRRCATGGARVGDRGYFYAPTVVSGLRQDDEIIQDEVFGPVITVQRFTDEDEAVALGQRRRVRPGRLGLDQGPRPGDADDPPARLRLRLGQHATSRSSPRCRTAASSTPATARTCRCTAWRTTPGSSTSCTTWRA